MSTRPLMYKIEDICNACYYTHPSNRYINSNYYFYRYLFRTLLRHLEHE